MGLQADLFEQAIAENSSSLGRLARSYEADADKRRDLLQQIQIAIWRSLPSFNGGCSLRTWVYRVAHNVAASHVLRAKRSSSRLVDLEGLEEEPNSIDGQAQVERADSVAVLLDLIQRLKPLDRQIILLYLEGERAADIGDVTGLTEGNVATKIHRIKKILQRQFASEGGSHA